MGYRVSATEPAISHGFDWIDKKELPPCQKCGGTRVRKKRGNGTRCPPCEKERSRAIYRRKPVSKVCPDCGKRKKKRKGGDWICQPCLTAKSTAVKSPNDYDHAKLSARFDQLLREAERKTRSALITNPRTK